MGKFTNLIQFRAKKIEVISSEGIIVMGDNILSIKPLNKKGLYQQIFLGVASGSAELRLVDFKNGLESSLSVSKFGADFSLKSEKDSGKGYFYCEGNNASLNVSKREVLFEISDGIEKLFSKLSMGSGKNGPAFTIYDEKGHPRAVLGRTELMDKKGRTILCPESPLVLFDEKGKVLFEAP